MTEFKSFRSIIELWSTREECAAELGAKASQVSKWWQRDNVPSEWWAALLRAPTAIAAGLSAERMAALAAQGSKARAGCAEGAHP